MKMFSPLSSEGETGISGTDDLIGRDARQAATVESARDVRSERKPPCTWRMKCRELGIGLPNSPPEESDESN